MNKTFIGIDIGLDGALAVLEKGNITHLKVMPTFKSTKARREYNAQEIYSFLLMFKDKNPFVIFERTHAMPQIGVVQSYGLGKGTGIIIGLITALGYPYQIVHAKTWQKEMFRDINSKDTKQASKIIAQRLFPKESFLATERSKVMHSGLTDAVLLCSYGERVLH